MLRVINQGVEEVYSLIMPRQIHEVAQTSKQPHDCIDAAFIFPAHQNDRVLMWSLSTGGKKVFIQEQLCAGCPFASSHEFPNVVERVTHRKINAHAKCQSSVRSFRHRAKYFGGVNKLKVT